MRPVQNRPFLNPGLQQIAAQHLVAVGEGRDGRLWAPAQSVERVGDRAVGWIERRDDTAETEDPPVVR
jgi:hypothetical protein